MAILRAGSSILRSQVCTSHKASYDYLWIRAALLGCALFISFVIPVADGRKVSELGAHSALPSSVGVVRNHCDLRCWLGNLTLSIPGKNFTAGIKPLRYTLSIPSFTCHGISLGGVHSKFRPPLSVSLDPYGIGTSCTTTWELYNTESPSKKTIGTIDATVDDTAFANVTVKMVEAGDGLASGAKCTSCKANAKVSKIVFSKDDAWFLNLFEGLIKDFLNAELPSLICADGLSPLIDENVTSAILSLDELIRPYLSPMPPPSPPHIPPGNINLTDNAVVGVVDYVVDTLMGVNGSLNINTVVGVLTNHTGDIRITNVSSFAKEIASLVGQDIPTSFTIPIDDYGKVTIGLLQFNASGLDKWKGINIFQPAGSYMLKSFTNLGSLNVNVSFYVNVSIGSSPVIRGGDLYEEAMVTLAITDATLNASMVLALNDTLLKSFKPSSELIDPNCLLWAVNDLNFTQTLFNMTVGELGLFAVGGDVEEDLDDAVDNILKLFVTSFNTAIPAILTGAVQGPGRQAFNSIISDNIAVNHSCYDNATSSHGKPLFNVFSSAIAFAGAGFVWLLISAWCLAYTVYGLVRRYHAQRRGDEFSTADGEHPGSLQARYKTLPSSDVMVGGYDNEDDAEMSSIGSRSSAASNGVKFVKRYVSFASKFSDDQHRMGDEDGRDSMVDTRGSLLLHPVIFWPVRVLMPLFILYSISLFISSNTSVGAQIYIKVVVDHFTETLPPLFDFSLGNTVKDMWNAGVYPLSLMVACFSGAWPYIKLLLMLVCWVLPTWLLRPKLREVLLMVVDALGKWSLLDIYIMTMFIVAFHFKVPMPADTEAGTSKGDMNINAYVGAEPGFYTFLLATIMSLILGHIAVYYHRKVMNAPRRRELKCMQKKMKSKALWGMNFRLLGIPVRLTKLGRLFVAGLLLISMVLSVVGIVITSFSFKFEGAAAAALELIDQPTTQHYSVITLAYNIPSSTEFPNSIGIRLIQATFYIFAVVMPLIFLIVAFVLWVIPLRPFLQRMLFVTTEICNAWAALDVFVVSIIAALLELPKFSQFIIGDKCDLINQLIRRYVPDGVLAVDKCFVVETTLDEGCWVLFSAILIYLFAGTLVIWICHNVLEEREEQAAKAIRRAKSSFESDDGSSWGAASDDEDDDGRRSSVKMILGGKRKVCRGCGMVIALLLKYAWLITLLDEEEATSEANYIDGMSASAQEGDETFYSESGRVDM